VENASAEQVRSTTATEIKPTAQTVAKPAVKAASRSGKPAVGDPILQPRAYSADARLRKHAGAEAVPPESKPTTQYTRQPVPASKRWFGWMRREAQPAAPAPGQMPTRSAPPARMAPSARPAPPAQPAVIEAAYHPDPMYRLIGSLRDELLPSMREVAAMSLCRGECRGRPEVVAALVQAAQHDPAPTVRACCVRCLSELQVRSPECLAVLRALEQDGDTIVRVEATNALATLGHP
jgi:hypothetical protein